MDEERRALVRRLAADPQDPVAGPQLARLLARSHPKETELRVGVAALVIRPSFPRPAFAWRPSMDRAVGRVGWVRAVAKDELSCEIDVQDVGRFHVGAASIAALPELHRRQASGTFNALDGSVGPVRVGKTIEDLRRMGSQLLEDEPGPLGPDGLTQAQRLLLAQVPEHEAVPLEDVAIAAGFTAENNRTRDSALAFLYGMSDKNERVRRSILTIEAPVLLAGDVVPGPLDTGSWTFADLLVARLPGSTAFIEGLPWAVVNGVRTSQHHAPPHEPTEVADALVKLLQNPRAGLDEIFMIEGPDYPGGGEVGSRGDIGRLYATGGGEVRLRASIEKQLPGRIFVRTPWPDEAPGTLEQVVRDALRAGRLDGVGDIVESGALRVDLERGEDPGRLETVKQTLQELLPIEQAVSYRLPAPLVWWLRTFLDEKRRSGLTDPEIHRRISEARSVAFSGRRRTHVF